MNVYMNVQMCYIQHYHIVPYKLQFPDDKQIALLQTRTIGCPSFAISGQSNMRNNAD